MNNVELSDLRREVEGGETVLYYYESPVNEYSFSVTKKPKAGSDGPVVVVRKYFFDNETGKYLVEKETADSIANVCALVSRATMLGTEYLENHIEELKIKGKENSE